MLVTDVSMRVDPIYGQITRRWLDHPEEMNEAFAKAWYKLMHRDMGPIDRYLGPWVAEPQLWQDPVPAVDHALIDDADAAELKRRILDAGLSVAELVATTWAAASTFRGSDKRGGANGARIRLAPQKDWEVNKPAQLARVLRGLGEAATVAQCRRMIQGVDRNGDGLVSFDEFKIMMASGAGFGCNSNIRA
jgi:catalase-peroxidase